MAFSEDQLREIDSWLDHRSKLTGKLAGIPSPLEGLPKGDHSTCRLLKLVGSSDSGGRTCRSQGKREGFR